MFALKVDSLLYNHEDILQMHTVIKWVCNFKIEFRIHAIDISHTSIAKHMHVSFYKHRKTNLNYEAFMKSKIKQIIQHTRRLCEAMGGAWSSKKYTLKIFSHCSTAERVQHENSEKKQQ